MGAGLVAQNCPCFDCRCLCCYYSRRSETSHAPIRQYFNSEPVTLRPRVRAKCSKTAAGCFADTSLTSQPTIAAKDVG